MDRNEIIFAEDNPAGVKIIQHGDLCGCYKRRLEYSILPVDGLSHIEARSSASLTGGH